MKEKPLEIRFTDGDGFIIIKKDMWLVIVELIRQFCSIEEIDEKHTGEVIK